MTEKRHENHPDQPARQIRCFTRAVKNARYLQQHDPANFAISLTYFAIRFLRRPLTAPIGRRELPVIDTKQAVMVYLRKSVPQQSSHPHFNSLDTSSATNTTQRLNFYSFLLL